MSRKRIIRTQTYRDDLDAIERYIAKDNRRAATELWLAIDEQVECLSNRAPLEPLNRGLMEPAKG